MERALRSRVFRQALSSLEEVAFEVEGVPRAILRDARIQRFEFTFEALWKFLQSLATAEGLDAASPRKALQAALRMGLLDDEDEEAAFEVIRYRNLTVHTYDEDLAEEVERFILGPGLDLLQKIARRTSSTGGDAAKAS